MSLNYNSFAQSITVATPVSLFTVPNDSAYVVGSIVLSNTHASTNTTVTLQVTDDSESDTANILTAYPLNAQTSEEVLSHPINLEYADILKITCADANVIDIYVSYLKKARNQ